MMLRLPENIFPFTVSPCHACTCLGSVGWPGLPLCEVAAKQRPIGQHSLRLLLTVFRIPSCLQNLLIVGIAELKTGNAISLLAFCLENSVQLHQQHVCSYAHWAPKVLWSY